MTGLDSGLPLGGVVVATNGVQTVSGASGMYRLALLPGDYTISYSLPGYANQTKPVTITAGNELVLDVALNLASDVVVKGIVKDGAGHIGLPVYARVDISNYAGGPVFTNPLTGVFQVTLSELSSYSLVVTALSGGYLPLNLTLDTPAAQPADPDVTLDIAMPLSTEACAPAPGYASTGGFIERFTDGVTPSGWQVLDYANAQTVWQFNNPSGSLNKTGGSGLFAGITDIDTLGKGYNSGLISPLLDFSAESSVMLSFRSDIDNSDAKMVAGVDVSADGGQTSEPVWAMLVSSPGPAQYSDIDLTTIAADGQ